MVENMENVKKCRRCSSLIEEARSCGERNCPVFNARDNWKPELKKKWGVDLADKYFIRNLCNSCENLLEKTLLAFLNCKINEKTISEIEEKTDGNFIKN